MGNTKEKEMLSAILLTIAVLGALCFSVDWLFLHGVLGACIQLAQTHEMALELTFLGAMTFLLLTYAPGKWKTGGLLFLFSGFLWIHRILIPILVSGCYLLVICLIGMNVGRRKMGLLRNFLKGSAAVITLFCLMSAVGIGSIPWLTAALLVAGGVAAVRCWRGKWVWSVSVLKEADKNPKPEYSPDVVPELYPGSEPGLSDGFRRKYERSTGKNQIFQNLGLTFLILIFAIQAGRMNGAIDFDSLWYGVRSSRILDMGKGIYENPGMIGVVYTYSKGLETLTLPLSVLPSFSFQISFNWWLLILILYGVYRIASHMMSPKMARYLAVFLSAVPAITNMSITAKTDLITLLFQVVMIEELIRSRKGEDGAFGYAAGAFLLSWTMKPTALLFSSAVFGMGGLGNLGLWQQRKRMAGAMPGRREQDQSHREKRSGFVPKSGPGYWISGACDDMLCVALALTALTGIWARTFLITGIPVTSVFSSIFTRMGFHLKYPFSVQTIPNAGESLGLAVWLREGMKRLLELLFAPTSGEMLHVFVAWGGLSLWFVIALVCVLKIQKISGKYQATNGLITQTKTDVKTGKVAPDKIFWNQADLHCYFFWIFLPFTAGNLLSLFMLTQVDGNYFELLYVLWAIWGFGALDQLKPGRLKKTACTLAVVVTCYGGLITGLTNWSESGYQGLFPAKLIHRGYYDHELTARDRFAAEGRGEIWDLLAADSRNRVIAIGRHTESLFLPCCVQTYEDVTGSQGNVMLVKTMDNFVEFLDYAKTDYIYIEAGYIAEGERADTLTCDLVEYGILTPVCYENGSVLARVDVHGEKTEESEKNLAEFKQNRRLREL